MEWYLPRGFALKPGIVIKRMIESGQEWQIYLTNNSAYALAVSSALYDRWVNDYCLPEGLFLEKELFGFRVFLSSGEYLVSSTEKGPFPEDIGQIEAFSIAFKTATNLFSDVDLYDAIYIEEFSLLLPTWFSEKAHDDSIVYGKWLTGGVNIPITSFDRVSTIMSWTDPSDLAGFAQLAGFKVEDSHDAKPDNKEAFDVPDDKRIDSVPNTSLPSSGFSLVGRPALEQFFNDNIVDIVLHREQYERMGISFPGATILYGPPGCGKTYAVEKLAEYLGWQRFDIDSSTIASSYIHDTSKKISEVFNNAIEAAPSVLIIDEMEAFLSNRNMANTSGTYHIEEVAEFLRRIPEAVSKGVLIFAMTNLIDSIDPAILRRGRFDHIVEVKMATAEEIEVLLKSRFASLPVDDSVDPAEIAKALDGHPMSDIAFILREAGRFAVKQNKPYMDQKCFDNALDLLPKKKENRKIGFDLGKE